MKENIEDWKEEIVFFNPEIRDDLKLGNTLLKLIKLLETSAHLLDEEHVATLLGVAVLAFRDNKLSFDFQLENALVGGAV